MDSLFIEGWNPITLSGERIVVYSQQNKALFALKKGLSPKNITILVNSTEKRSSLLGTQFGLLEALSEKCIGLHGVTLLCGNEIVILSAPSGTGKTTLARLLEKYCDAITVNGDFALLHPCKEGVIFEPTPFCGTSGRCLKHRLLINRVVFLGQSTENRWQELRGREAMTRFFSNAFIPTWDKKIENAIQKNVLRCISMLKVNSFDFAPTQHAAEVFYERIEKKI